MFPPYPRPVAAVKVPTMNRRILIAAALPLSLALSGCGLKPLYAGGSGGTVASLLSQIDVAPIEGQSGWLVRNALRDRMAASGGGMAGANARYRLVIRLDDRMTGYGVRRDDSVTRERRELRARYQLVAVGTGETLLDATTGSDVGIDVVSSDYATVAAEASALERLSGLIADQIVTRLARYADSAPPAP